MNNSHFVKIAAELEIQLRQIEATVNLLDEGGTIPFISRYRKEMTGSLDEVVITQIRDRIAQLRDLDKRREAILKSLKEQEKLTPELEEKVNAAETMAELEDIYLPYKPKRRTKATIAREKGLEPLAKDLFEQEEVDLDGLAKQFLDEEKGVTTKEEALQGARDIIAEWVNENQEARAEMRDLFLTEGKFRAKVMTGKEEEGQKYKDYFEWEEDISSAPSHRVLAMRRGEKEMVLMLDSCPEEASAVGLLNQQFVQSDNESAQQVEQAVKDSYRRLMKPSMETEIRLTSKKKADDEAIAVFADNLRQLLLAAPLGQKNVLALDPGFRTGCKLVCLDSQGKLLHHDAIYPNEPQKKVAEATAKVKAYCEQFNIEAIAIGNGTASRETESFVRSLNLPKNITIVMVNESGASIYSASEVAREEFPDYDVTVRGAVSIGRRLMDPLAELVKIDAKSIGVGQYQHDVDQTALKNSLDDVVMSCVNAVGVEVNTCSKQLLTYVSGLGPQLAQNIIDYRNENGPFKSRAELKKVPRLGAKAFEQAAGFLRIRGAANPLDTSGVHPESYPVVKHMADDLGCKVKDLIQDGSLRSRIDLKNYVSENVGLPTLNDIMEELAKPGRDPREGFEAFSFMEGVNEMEDLKIGMELPGIVTNITQFGAFVDIGVHQDGLVHVSHLADKFVSNPAEEVSVQQKVKVTVLEVDIPRKRISLSMKSDPFKKTPQKPAKKSQRREQQSEGGDFQDKLAMLKGKFKMG
ncbi:Tex family protein [Xanthovirga aplysinae]|uniref:Tex family protein n=1 Tax=Xanthovirga aplysinae TaxID=2529853 RepID=UPI0012BC86C9|nr:Tex family protein [Xanthovirga aplysinae]MTI32639.1 RNA-binding transcriptional accessory protein [Xanthovirga aplysinae]